MRTISAQKVIEAVKELCIIANYKLPNDVLLALKLSEQAEISDLGKMVLQQIIQNAQIAQAENLPICQDTGTAIFFIELGAEVNILDLPLDKAVTEGVKQGYTEGYLRQSIVKDPLTRINTKNNTPPVIHTEIVKGSKIKIIFLPKGGGAENMSALKMLIPAAGIEGIKQFVLDTVASAKGNPCPPIIVGIGVGGTFDTVAHLAKKALLRKIGAHHPQPQYAKLEEDLLTEINKLGIGPLGFGGKITALSVNIENAPCHIASLPVAVNLQCHAARLKSVIL